jgi:uncharacterized membrane protein YoaT (DUF817 family)
VYEFVRFGAYMAWASLFGGLMLATLLATYMWYPDVSYVAGVHASGLVLARYDFLFLFALCVQGVLVRTHLETKEEAMVIFLFHIVGTVMEVFKTSMGSWVYPEEALFRIMGVPLFTGFMYASVGSFIARCARLCDFRFTKYPPVWMPAVLASAMYVNFFTHHFVTDVRYVLFVLLAAVYGRTWIYFRVWEVHRRMPLLLGFVLTAFFIWLAENVGTFAGAWVYPNQVAGWHMVPAAKLGSWLMLVVLSFVLTMWVRGVSEGGYRKR